MVVKGILILLSLSLNSYADYCKDNAKVVAHYKNEKNKLANLTKGALEKKSYHNSPFRSIKDLIKNKCVTYKDINVTEELFNHYQKIYFKKRKERLDDIIKMKANYKDVSAELAEYKSIHSMDKSDYRDFVAIEKEKKMISFYEANGKLRIAETAKKINQISCTNKDNRTAALGRVRDQDSVGWCFSYVASDLLTHKTNKKVSSIGVAMSYYKNAPKLSTAYAGDTRNAFNAAYKDGLCLESELPSDDFFYTLNGKDLKNQILPIVKRIEEINSKEITKRAQRPKINFMNPPQLKTWDEIVEFIKKNSVNSFHSCSEEYKELKYLFPNLDYNDMNRIMGEAEVGALFQDLKKANCKIFKPSKKMEAKSTYYKPLVDERLKMIKQLNSILDKGDIAGISYDPTIFSVKDSVTNDGGHASSIVARRFNKKSNKCEYLIRNSWGAHYKSKNYETDKGNMWVPVEDVMGNTQRLHYVE